MHKLTLAIDFEVGVETVNKKRMEQNLIIQSPSNLSNCPFARINDMEITYSSKLLLLIPVPDTSQQVCNQLWRKLEFKADVSSWFARD